MRNNGSGQLSYPAWKGQAVAMQYPKREAFFAHRFVRVLHKTCAAQDLGVATCYLLCVVAHTEDAAHYRGPVRFWNSQLMETLAFRSPKQLNDARQKAVQAGWLHYQRDHDRSVGKYFVLIPDRFRSISDAPIEPDSEWPDDIFLSAGGTGNGTESGTGKVQKGNTSRNGNVTLCGTPSIPDPFPVPSPKEGAAAAANDSADGDAKKYSPEQVLLPLELDTPEFKAARNEWFAQRRRRRLSLRLEYLEGQFRRLAPLGAAQAAACLLYTVAQDYDGIFPDKFGGSKNGKSLAGSAGQTHDPTAATRDPDHGRM